MTDPQQAVQAALRFLNGVLDRSAAGDRVGIRLWEGTGWPEDRPCAAWLELRHPGAFKAMFGKGTELGLAEAYLFGDFDITGELEAVFPLLERLAAAFSGWRQRLRAAALLLPLPPAPGHREQNRRRAARLAGRQHSRSRDRQAVTYHYDLSNAFYALWLDRNLVYSCGYFDRPDAELDTAQEQKLDLLCRKLRLRPGQRLLDLGCGWGGLLRHAAGRYGVDATGITLSRPQAELANERISADGCEARARALVCDYRELPPEPQYDAIASVGMFEHVGARHLHAYFEQVWRLLKPGGVFLNHGIARCPARGTLLGTRFIQAYVFPDGQLTPLSRTLQAAEQARLEIRDVECLREHYARTLRLWLRRLEARHEAALALVDELTYRVWRLYLAGSAHGFETGRLNLYQTLFSKSAPGGRAGLPLTRADWYVRMTGATAVDA